MKSINICNLKFLVIEKSEGIHFAYNVDFKSLRYSITDARKHNRLIFLNKDLDTECNLGHFDDGNGFLCITPITNDKITLEEILKTHKNYRNINRI